MLNISGESDVVFDIINSLNDTDKSYILRSFDEFPTKDVSAMIIVKKPKKKYLFFHKFAENNLCNLLLLEGDTRSEIITYIETHFPYKATERDKILELIYSFE